VREECELISRSFVWASCVWSQLMSGRVTELSSGGRYVKHCKTGEAHCSLLARSLLVSAAFTPEHFRHSSRRPQLRESRGGSTRGKAWHRTWEPWSLATGTALSLTSASGDPAPIRQSTS